MAEHRYFKFNNIHEIMPEVDRLLASGYAPVGKWNLGMVSQHLAQTFQKSIEGFGVKIPWIIRATIGKIKKKEVFKKEAMEKGIPVPQAFLPQPGLEDRPEAEALRAAINYYAADTNPRAPHPFFGPLTNAEWEKLHCIHAAHHLGFLIPNE
jgi:hypothetical protein